VKTKIMNQCLSQCIARGR